MEAFRLSYHGVVSTVPLIIFAYMYQVNVPMIFLELEKREQTQMSKVLIVGTSVAVILYVLVGIFGYATFLAPPISNELCPKNILEANY